MPNANTDWQRRPLQDAGLNGPAYINDRLGKAIEPAEQFVDVKERCQPMDIGLNEYL
jgi:hypothetical protein